MCHKCPEHFFQDRNSLKGYPDKVSEAPSTVARFPFLLRQVFWGGPGGLFSVLGGLGVLLGALGAVLGRSWAVLGVLGAFLRRSWDLVVPLGTVLGQSRPLLGRSWAALGRSWAFLGWSWGIFGPLLACSSPLWGDLGVPGSDFASVRCLVWGGYGRAVSGSGRATMRLNAFAGSTRR